MKTEMQIIFFGTKLPPKHVELSYFIYHNLVIINKAQRKQELNINHRRPAGEMVLAMKLFFQLA
jgi:hypothetical protein